MNIKTRSVCGKYIGVMITDYDTTIDLGTLDETEALTLIGTLRDTADELETMVLDIQWKHNSEIINIIREADNEK